MKFKEADDKIIQSICWLSYENSIIQAILNNMNLSQLSDRLQSVKKVIQFCQEKKTGAYALIVPGFFKIVFSS